jgi:hypothetical protein
MFIIILFKNRFKKHERFVCVKVMIWLVVSVDVTRDTYFEEGTNITSFKKKGSEIWYAMKYITYMEIRHVYRSSIIVRAANLIWRRWELSTEFWWGLLLERSRLEEG